MRISVIHKLRKEKMRRQGDVTVIHRKSTVAPSVLGVRVRIPGSRLLIQQYSERAHLLWEDRVEDVFADACRKE